MTKFFTQMFAIALIGTVVGGSMFIASDAEAKKGREVQIQTYDFKDPHDGYEGTAGGGYCSYRKEPKRKCFSKSGKRVCKVVGWRLVQICQ